MIEIISGTNRPGSNSLKVAKIVQKAYEVKGVTAGIIDLQEMPAEIFSPDSYAAKPASFQPMQDRVLAAKGLHLVIPEYNGSYPGALKYFIDMLKFPESLEGRRVAMIGLSAGIWGNLRGIEQMQQVFGYRNSFIFPERVFIALAGKKISEDGTVINDPLVNQLLDSQISGFINFATKA